MLPTLLVSGCLLGLPVRYDGGHKHDAALMEKLARHFSLRAICPEEAGFGVPREPMHLEGEPPRLITNHGRREVGFLLENWCHLTMARIIDEKIAGVVLKARSPSCGIIGQKGLFVRALEQHFPLLPLVESENIQDGLDLNLFIAKALETPTNPVKPPY